jgi:lysophospholipase L1-like esterase
MKKLLALFIFIVLFTQAHNVQQIGAATEASFNAEYFANTNLSGAPTLVRAEPSIDYDWVLGSPHPSLPVDNFSARWTTTLDLSEGSYYFQTRSDDGVRLFVNGDLVIDKWIDQPPTTHGVTLELPEGEHTVVMEYYEKAAGAVAQLEWTEVTPPSETGTKIMPLGDSITHGYNEPGGYRIKLATLLEEFNFVGSQQNGPGSLADKDHEGYPGWHINQIRDNIANWINGAQPEYILLNIGVNDMGDNSNWQLASTRLGQLIDETLAVNPNIELFVSNLTPAADSQRNDRVNQFNSEIIQIIEAKQSQGKKVHFVDLNIAVTFADLADELHPSLGGYNKMADKWAEAIEIVENGGTPDLPELPAPPEPPEYPEPSEGYFTAEYFNNMSLSGVPDLVRSDDVINFSWSSGSPDLLIAPDNFSARWAKPHTFEDGTYKFTVTADDGFRLKLDGAVILEKWIDQAPTTYSVEVPVTAGEKQIVLEYYEKGGGATAKLEMEKLDDEPVIIDEEVPTEAFNAEYFNNMTLSGVPTLVTTVDEVNFVWGLGSPDPSINVNNFSARWQKIVTFDPGEYRFSVTADDGFRLKIDGVTVLDRWIDQPPTTYTVDVELDGESLVTLEYYEKGAGATAILEWEMIDAVEPPDIELGEGFLAEYFDNMTLSGQPKFVREDAAIDFNWGGGSPNALIPIDNFSARWTKPHTFEDGTYKFTVTADDGFRLKLDGAVILEKWIDQAPTIYSVEVPVTAGEKQIVLEYYEKGGGATAKLELEKLDDEPIIIDEEVPDDAFIAEYFNNMTLSGVPTLVTTVNEVNFIWGVGSPHATINVNNFSARWQKLVTFDPGEYRFSVTADDGFRLKIDGVTVLDKWIDQPPTTYTVDVDLDGESLVTLEYYEKGAGATAILGWEEVE